MKKNLQLFALVALLCVPSFALAQNAATDGLTTFGGIIDTLTQTVVRALATLFATLAMVAFFFGVTKFIWASREGEAAEIEKGKKFMLWSLIALFVMFSVWGIIYFFQDIFKIQGRNNIIIPTIQVGGGGPTGGSPSGSPSGSNPLNGGTPGSIYVTPTGGAGMNASAGADCVTNAECGGLQCVNFRCQASGGSVSGGSGCSGRSEGASCTVGGRAGTCTSNDEGVFGCYVNSGGSPQYQGDSDAYADDWMPANNTGGSAPNCASQVSENSCTQFNSSCRWNPSNGTCFLSRGI